jgi:hypothetical protein
MMEAWETIFLNENRCDDLPDGFGSGPSRLLRSLRAQREAEITTSTLDKLLRADVDVDELLKAGSPSGIGEAIRIMEPLDDTDPLAIFGEDIPLELHAADPRARKFAKRITNPGGTNREKGYGWRFEIDPETGDEVVKGFAL